MQYYARFTDTEAEVQLSNLPKCHSLAPNLVLLNHYFCSVCRVAVITHPDQATEGQELSGKECLLSISQGQA